MDSLGLWKASSGEKETVTIPKKMKQVKCNYSNSKKYYEKLGSAGIKGSLYQIDLLTMVLLNGMRKVESWRLSTEDKEAAQLDDLIFERLPSASTILLQAKHKEDESKEVTYKDLMSVNKNSEFSLPKYFFSYQEVKNKFKLQNVAICTNLKLDKKTKSILKQERVDPGSVLHFEGAENICYGFNGCALPELKMNIMTYYAKHIKRKKVAISDEDINDFLNHLKFFSNCLGDKNVENIVQQTITQMKFSEDLNSKTIQTYIQKKMTDWFKEKKGRYLTEVEAKAFFCDMRSNKYCEDLKLYDIGFKKNNLPLVIQTQQTNKKGEKSLQRINSDGPVQDPKRISHIIPDEEYILNVVKTYQALPAHHKDKTLFVNPEETVEIQRQIIDAFEVQHYTILVMVCPNTIEETIAAEMCDRVTEILVAYKYKHLILIAEEKNDLAKRLKNANLSWFEVITDNLTFTDLEETTQRVFKRKRLINFQGCTVSLEELFPPPTGDDLNQIVKSEMMIKLARNRKSEVGVELQRPDNYYICRSFNRNGQNTSEEDLWRSTEVSEGKVILFSDPAGMGKSSVLTSLAISIKRNNPHLWVVRFDLNNYSNVMRRILEEGRKSVSVIELLNSQVTSNLKSEFEIKLFTTPKRVVLILDGVDEISPTYTELVINLIRDSLAQANLAKIFVTARPHMFKDLEEISELQPFTLKPFSKVNQIEFLVKYWTETMDLRDDTRKSKCKMYAEALIRKIFAWMNEGDRNNFAGIPLQTRMLAEIFQEVNGNSNEEHNWEGCKEFLSSNNEEPNLPTKIELTQLYEMFINRKCDIYIKKNNPCRHSAADEALKLQLKECQKFHRAMALKVIFCSDKQLQFFTSYTNVEWPILSTFANNFLFSLGIVQMQGGNIEFLHRTFAEYFVTECLLIELERKPVNEEFLQFFMRSILMDAEYYVIRAFFDSCMRNVLHSMENNFCSYFRQNRISEWSLSKYFEVFGEGGCARILECFIKCIDKEHREILSETIKLPLMYNALFPVIRHGHLNILKLLLELNETFYKGTDARKEFLRWIVMHAEKFNLETFKFMLRQVDKNDKNILGRSALHEAAFVSRFEEIKSLVDGAGMDINNKDNIFGWTALCEAALMGRLEVVRFLVEEAGADINIEDNDGNTALHTAVKRGELEIVMYLLKEGGANVNIKNNCGETALHTAVNRDDLQIVRFLVEQAEADVNIKDDVLGWTALCAAVFMGRLEVVRFLLEAGADVNLEDDDGKTALHTAIYRGELEIVKFLVEEAKADINMRDNDGWSVLHRAVNRDELEIVRFLVAAGLDVNTQDNDGRTVLHTAVYRVELETVKFLVEEAGVDVNTKDNGGWTALHTAVYRGELEIVQFLAGEAGADVNIEDNDGKTALYTAVSKGESEIIKCLVEEAEADINNESNDAERALLTVYRSEAETDSCLVEEAEAGVCIESNDAVYRSESEIGKCLVEEAKADTDIDSDGERAVHSVVYRNELEIVKCSAEEAGENINIKDKDGKTALHTAVKRGDLEIVKSLVNEGADINIKDNDGRTAFHAAVYRGELELAKYLAEAPRADINIRDSDGKTALHTAVYRGELEIAKYLAEEAAADINFKDNDGKTALHTAVYRGELEIVECLVRAGADVNIKINDGKTALHTAVYRGDYEIVKCLAQEAEADISIKDNDGKTALHTAVYRGELKIVQCLAGQVGRDINIKDNDVKTALHAAVHRGELEIVKCLVKEAGVDVNIKDSNGKTALHVAVCRGELEIVKCLVEVEAAADINIKDNEGKTALHRAVYRDELEVVKCLVEKAGADINIRDNDGKTALHTAVNKGELGIVKYLVEKAGADITIKDNYGKTPLRLAADRGHWKVVKFVSNSSNWVMFKMKTSQFFRGKFP